MSIISGESGDPGAEGEIIQWSVLVSDGEIDFIGALSLSRRYDWRREGDCDEGRVGDIRVGLMLGEGDSDSNTSTSGGSSSDWVDFGFFTGEKVESVIFLFLTPGLAGWMGVGRVAWPLYPSVSMLQWIQGS